MKCRTPPDTCQNSVVFFPQSVPHASEVQVEAFVDAIRPFQTFPGVTHYAFGPLTEPTAGEWDFGLYCRFRSRAALDGYLSSEAYKEVQEKFLEPLTETSLSLCWESEIPPGVFTPDIKAVHVKLYEMKPGMEDLSKTTVVGVLPVIMTSLPKTVQVGCGKNFDSGSHQIYHWGFVMLAESLELLEQGTQSDDIIKWKEGLLAFTTQESLVADFTCVI